MMPQKMSNLRVVNGVVLRGVISFAAFTFFGCQQQGESSKKPAEAKKTETPSGEQTPSDEKPSTTTDSKPCWDKFLETAEAKACSTIYAYSGRSCAKDLTPSSTCDVALIQSRYSAANINGTPAMDVVNQWIADGFKPHRCATGNAELYIYFLKQIFTPKESSSDGGDQYAIQDKKLGPAGPTLDSIVLQSTTTPAVFSCGE